MHRLAPLAAAAGLAALLAGCGDPISHDPETPEWNGPPPKANRNGPPPSNPTELLDSLKNQPPPGEKATPGEKAPPGEKAAPTEPTTPAAGPTPVEDSKYRTTPSGLKIAVLKEGSGTAAKAGDVVTVHYTGWLKDGGTKFDSSVDRADPFKFPLGQGQVIKGWDEGVAGMRPGEKRQLVIPAELGYGSRGFPPRIPPGATLVFDVELVSIGD